MELRGVEPLASSMRPTLARIRDQGHASTVTNIRLRSITNGVPAAEQCMPDQSQLVSLMFTDDDSGGKLLGSLADVHALIVEADRRLGHLARGKSE